MVDCPPTVYYPLEPYVTLEDLCAGCGNLDFTPIAADPDADPPVLAGPSADALLFAKMALYASRRVFIPTGGKFPGCVTTTWQPCRSDFCCDVHACGGDECNCTAWPKVQLPFGPVRSITSVTIDGDVLDPTKYQVNGKWLERIDGEPWPTCEGWEIVYFHGIDIPPEAKPFIAAYACELTKLCRGGTCELPNGYKVTKMGNTEYVVIDPLEYRRKLLTGYIPLDDWIVAIMGNHARTRPRIAGRRLGRRVANA